MRDLEVLVRDFILIPDYEILGCAKRTSFRKHRRGGRCRSLDLLVQLGSACARLVEQRLANLATCCRLAPSSHVLVEPAHASSNMFATHNCLAFAISKLNLFRWGKYKLVLVEHIAAGFSEVKLGGRRGSGSTTTKSWRVEEEGLFTLLECRRLHRQAMELRLWVLRLVPDEQLRTFSDGSIQISVTVISIVVAVISKECVDKWVVFVRLAGCVA